MNQSHGVANFVELRRARAGQGTPGLLLPFVHEGNFQGWITHSATGANTLGHVEQKWERKVDEN